MIFANPWGLWCLLFVLIWGTGWGLLLVRNYRRRVRRYAENARTFVGGPQGAAATAFTSYGLLFAALAGLALALARPQGAPAPSASARRGVNLAILIDGSRSMVCEDVLPTRLQVAQQAVETIASTMAGSRFSLFMFGGAPTLLIPKTFDTAAVTLAARSVSPDFVGKSGTLLDPALHRATEYLGQAGKQPKVIVVISDGEEGEGDPVLMAMQAFADHQVRIHTITVGTADGGPMPFYTRNAEGRRVRAGSLLNLAGQPVTTRANPKLMTDLAAGAGGRNLHLTGGDIAGQVRAFMTQFVVPEIVPIEDAATEQPQEWWWLPLGFAAACLLAEQALRHHTARRSANRRAPARRAILEVPPETGVLE